MIVIMSKASNALVCPYGESPLCASQSRVITLPNTLAYFILALMKQKMCGIYLRKTVSMKKFFLV
jgi:hypothetical protein